MYPYYNPFIDDRKLYMRELKNKIKDNTLLLDRHDYISKETGGQ